MLEHALVWWLVLWLLGCCAMPYLYTMFPGLPSRGLALARPCAALLLTLALWYLGTLRVLPNGRGAALLAAILVALGALWLFHCHRAGFLAFVARSRTVLLTVEVLFALLFFGLVFVRAHDPDIAGTEKPMDFALLNTAIRSDTFPPRDPWLSGFSVNYYYFGYLIVAALTNLAGTPPGAGYNLGLAFVFAAAGTGMAGLVADMVAQRRQRGEGGIRRGDLMHGALGALLLVGLGNLLAVFEVARARGWTNPELFRWLAIKRDEHPVTGIRFLGVPPDTPVLSPQWYPAENWWWWRSTRVIDTVIGGRSADYTITEFPAFSFLLGDLHPHVMALPFVVIAAALTLHLFLGPVPGARAWWVRSPWLFVPPWLILGSIGFINGWDLLPYLALFVAGGGVRIWLDGGPGWQPWVDGALWAGLVGAGALLLYLPFYGPLAMQTLTGTGALGGQGPPVVPWAGPGTRPVHFVVLWAPALLAVFGLLVGAAFSAGRGMGMVTLGGSSIMLAAWVWIELNAVGETEGPAASIAWPQRIWFLGGALLAFSVIAAYRRLRLRAAAPIASTTPVGSSLVFALLLVGAAFTLFWLCETVRIRDVFGNRMNTVFKLYYQAWVLLAAVAAFTVCYLNERRAGWGRVFRSGWSVSFSALVLLASVFPLTATFSKTGGFQRPVTLDGLAHLESLDPAEAEAIAWLGNQREPRNAVVLEAVGPQYSRFARFSSNTGVPTVLGWAGHEVQWRGSDASFRDRSGDIDAIYSAANKREVLPLVAHYRITHVAVGLLEQEKYPGASLAAFDEVFTPAFRSDRVTIYRTNAGS